MKPCIFCGRKDGLPSKEHVVPKWARDYFKVEGSLDLYMQRPGQDMERLHTLQHLNLTITRQVCRKCNNGWLAQLEKAVAPFLATMSKEFVSTSLDMTQLTLLSTWAAKTSFLLERSFRQKYARCIHDGYEGSEPELAWLYASHQPPPMARVWLACVDCDHRLPLQYEPSWVPLLCRDGSTMNAHITTFALGYVAFQVFSVDYLAAEQRGARRGWPEIPETIRPGILPVWPVTGPVDWPPPAFPWANWDQLVTWAGALRWESDKKPIRLAR